MKYNLVIKNLNEEELEFFKEFLYQEFENDITLSVMTMEDVQPKVPNEEFDTEGCKDCPEYDGCFDTDKSDETKEDPSMNDNKIDDLTNDFTKILEKLFEELLREYYNE